MKNQRGQVLLVLILIVTVALAIGISVIQRSLSDVSTSSQVDQSARAFSAAEAGIEKAIQADSSFSGASLNNNSTIQGVQRNTGPALYQALEYPLSSTSEMVHIWLADPSADPPAEFYDQPDIKIYWGLASAAQGYLETDNPALEVTVTYYETPDVGPPSIVGGYSQKRFFYDSDPVRRESNGFNDGNCTDNFTINTSEGNSRSFRCRTTIPDLPADGWPTTSTLMLLRARFLYSKASQPFAAQPLGVGCGTDACSLPLQSRTFIATGASGSTQRTVKVFMEDKVVPFYFDYAIFSASEITK